MRYLITILFLCVNLIASGTNYYVKTGGNDANTGFSDAQAWLTLSKVTTVWLAGTFVPGDSILLKRGDTFYGQVKITEGGTAGSPIIFGAYGTGVKPIITGLTTVPSWTSYGSGIYYYKIDCKRNQLYTLLFDGDYQQMGIFPDLPTKYYIQTRGYDMDTTSIDEWIYDADLPASPTFVGGDLVAIQNTGICSRNPITAQSSGTIWFNDEWATYGNVNINWRFFVQDHISTLTTLGEWYYDADTLFMYFGAETPGDYTVQVATQDTLLIGYFGDNYVHITDINFKGSNYWATCAKYPNYWTIKNCEVSFCGSAGFYFENADNCTVQDCNIHDIPDVGVYAKVGCDNFIAKDNTVRDIGLVPGSGNGTDAIGICVISGGGAVPLNTLAEYNTFRNIGRRGTWIAGRADTLRYNYFDSTGVTFKDAAGIYTGATDDTLYAVYQNIIINSFGSPQMAMAASGYGGGDGFAIDYSTRGVNIYNNVVSTGYNWGINQNRAKHFKLTGNIFYDFAVEGIALMEMSPVTGDPTGYTNEDFTVTGNIIVAVDSTQDFLRARDYTARANIAGWGTINNNYYLRDATDDYTNMVVYFPVLDHVTLAAWQTEFSYDLTSNEVQFADMTTVKLYYNNTKTDSTIYLSYPCEDVYGTIYVSSITLDPFTGAILWPTDFIGGSATGFLIDRTGVPLRNETSTKFMKIE